MNALFTEIHIEQIDRGKWQYGKIIVYAPNYNVARERVLQEVDIDQVNMIAEETKKEFPKTYEILKKKAFKRRMKK